MSDSPVKISYFSDVLCVWAYADQIRLDELRAQFGDRIEIEEHFITLFGCTQTRIGEGWQNKGGYDGFSQHVCQVGEKFDHLSINPKVWSSCRPNTSAMAHLVLKALQLHCHASGEGDRAVEKLANAIREAFFVDARDISSSEVLRDIMEEQDMPIFEIQDHVDDGTAMAALMKDMQLKERYQLEGSPSYVLNEGRQKLYGNIGYRVIEANIKELLERPVDCASWC
jgi:predicted DsbA family dithiol-disulfide isomerase